jgi:hypothetical protein
MEMDPIEYLLKQSQKKISLSILINAHSRLSIIQMNKGSVSFEDIMQSLTLSITAEMSSNELNGYAGLIYEGCFVPFMSPKGPLLRLSKDILGNDANFLKAMLNTLYSRADGSNSSVLTEDFKQEASNFLKKSNSSNANLLFEIPAPTFEPTSPALSAGSAPGDSHLATKSSSSNSGGLFPPPGISSSSTASSANANGGVKKPNIGISSLAQQSMFNETDENKLMSIGAEIEKNEPIIRLLAHIRKAGMDILFPQVIHDKVSNHIFFSSPPPLRFLYSNAF